jgi:hypothetical protein
MLAGSNGTTTDLSIAIGYNALFKSATDDYQLNIGSTIWGYLSGASSPRIDFRTVNGDPVPIATYNTYASETNYEKARLGFVGNRAQLRVEAQTGTLRELDIGASQIVMQTGASHTNRWTFQSDGHAVPASDAAYDLGTSALCVRDAYLSRNFVAGKVGSDGSITAFAASDFAPLRAKRSGSTTGFGTGTAFQLQNSSSAYVSYSHVLGVIEDSTASSEDGSLAFFTTTNGSPTEKGRFTSAGLFALGGGMTSSFPALKRSSAELHAVVADDSAFTTIRANGLGLGERASDPANPAEGQSIIWQSDGTGFGDDGDIVIKVTAGGVTKTVTLVDFSAVTDEEP